MTELNLSAANEGVLMLRNLLLPTVFLLCFLGYFETCSRSRGYGQSIMHYWVTVAVIVILTVSFPAAIETLRASIKGAVDTHNEAVQNKFYELLHAKLDEQPSGWFDMGNWILYGAIRMLQGIGRAGLILVGMLQRLSLMALIAISPLCLGFLATSWTRGAGVRYLLTCLVVTLWPLASSICDLILMGAGEYVFAAALGAGGLSGAAAVGAGGAAGLTVSTMALPGLLIAMTIAALVPIGLYLSCPLILGAIFLGANPITAAIGGAAGMVATGSGVAGMAAGRAISMGGALASRAAGASGGSGSGGGAAGSNGGGSFPAPGSSISPSPMYDWSIPENMKSAPSSGGATSSGSVGPSSAPSGGVRGFMPSSGGATTSISIPGPRPPTPPTAPPKPPAT